MLTNNKGKSTQQHTSRLFSSNESNEKRDPVSGDIAHQVYQKRYKQLQREIEERKGSTQQHTPRLFSSNESNEKRVSVSGDVARRVFKMRQEQLRR